MPHLTCTHPGCHEPAVAECDKAKTYSSPGYVVTRCLRAFCEREDHGQNSEAPRCGECLAANEAEMRAEYEAAKLYENPTPEAERHFSHCDLWIGEENASERRRKQQHPAD